MDAQEVLDFWFLPASSAGHGKQRAEWFRKDDAFDAAIRERFGAAIQHAIAGGLREWDEQGPRGVLARILVLDQFTRNAHRGTPDSFAGDPLALGAARQLVESGAHMELSPLERVFVYMPFEHAEDARMQERSVELFTDLAASHDGFNEQLDYAHRHRGVIARFGRFPHRNPILGRASTSEEQEYLDKPGSGFGVAPTLNLVGAGHVGRVLGRLFANSGAFVVQDVLTRSHDSARAAVDFIGAGRACTDIAALQPAQAWLLAVSDDQIAPVCAALAQAHDLRGALVFHCSGAKASGELQAAAAQGALVASVHPIRSFADPDAVARDFPDTFCGIEGDADALALLGPAFEAIGARLVPIDAAAKTVYHAAAVFASNYLVTVLDAALRAYQAADVPEEVARELARPLASEAMANVFRLGPAAALSGPVARGDHATVARQQQALMDWDPATGKLYEALLPLTADLARRKRDQH